MQRIFAIGLVLGLALLISGSSSAQIQMPYNVFGNGGGGGTGTNHVLKGTVGQVFTGVIGGGGSHIHKIGFWYLPYWSPTPVDEEAGMPSVYTLGQNHPNPFNPVTTIRYAVPEAARVTMKLYDIKGRLVRDLVSEDLEPGFYEMNLNASGMTSGVYFYKMVAGPYTETRKLMILK